VPLPGEIKLLLFRIAQEALSNAGKHSGATEAVIKLHYRNNKITMTISDNGKGFQLSSQANSFVENGKLGITGMHERARLLGGTLRIDTEPGKEPKWSPRCP
jgi:signal transduction histidine kinase